MLITGIIAAVVVASLLVGGIVLYNRLVRLRNTVDGAWSGIDVELNRRWDLIPNLVETVKGYAAHESSTLQAVIDARQTGVAAKGVAEQAEAEFGIGAALGKLFALAEAYPELKADENFRQLQEDLEQTESRVAFSRQYYNEAVLKYENARQTFPNNLVAGAANFEAKEYFRPEDPEARGAVRVDLS